MNIKDYISEKEISIKKLAENSGMPYSTVNDIINGKNDIDRVSVKNALSLAKACGVSFDYFYKLCKEDVIPQTKYGKIIIRNKKYYLEKRIKNNTLRFYLCNVNPSNRQFIPYMAKWAVRKYYDSMAEERKKAEVRNWHPENIL